MKRLISRRAFLKAAAAGTLAAGGIDWLGLLRQARAAEGAKPLLAVMRNGTPEAMTRAAVDALGGMKAFVGPGEVVVLKPNIGWDRLPEQAANTNPAVVRTVAEMCLEAGAKAVRVMDRTCNDPRRCYKRSGIQDALLALDNPAVTVEHIDNRKFVDVAIPDGESLREWSFYQEMIEADKIINIPIAKHHNAARLTMGLKNVMGCLGGNRGNIHRDLDRNIADLNTVMRFDLTVLDAVRILTAGGPQGGNVRDVKETNQVAAGRDVVSVDSYGATLFGIHGSDVPHVKHAARLGLGEIDLGRVQLIERDLSAS